MNVRLCKRTSTIRLMNPVYLFTMNSVVQGNTVVGFAGLIGEVIRDLKEHADSRDL